MVPGIEGGSATYKTCALPIVLLLWPCDVNFGSESHSLGLTYWDWEGGEWFFFFFYFLDFFTDNCDSL